MITRSTLVEQLRDYQIRSQNKCRICCFCVKNARETRFPGMCDSDIGRDAIGALSWGLLFCLLVVASYVMLYFRYHWLSVAIIFIGILIPVSVNIRQRKLAKKKERRFLLPLSM